MPKGVYNRPNLKTRFWRYASRQGPIHPICGQCWTWEGMTDKDGYGKLAINSISRGAHRVSWMIHFGEIPSSVGVLHECDNRLCVNPDHLFLGTNGDNVRDCQRKGRLRYGEDHPKAILSEDDVRGILQAYREGYGITNLSRIFKVSYGAIDKIVKGNTWRHIER